MGWLGGALGAAPSTLVILDLSLKLTAGPERFDPCVAFSSVIMSALLIFVSECSPSIDLGCSECALVVSVASMLCLWFVFGSSLMCLWCVFGLSLIVLCWCVSGLSLVCPWLFSVGVSGVYSVRLWFSSVGVSGVYSVLFCSLSVWVSGVCSVLFLFSSGVCSILFRFSFSSLFVLFLVGQGKRPSLLAFPDGANTFPMRGSIVWVSWLFSGSRKSVSIRCGGSVVVRGGGVGVGCFSVV